ncbi:MAG TPA: asparagine synthase C-terminal domain-containing protein [Steroidobacteraceae bacterium]|jgi:asparagine synthase (glutamine-hydrolysing)|nr:asparagine synthase C-terminal domain-containing protein [Steroidobacteraceae bacterium]
MFSYISFVWNPEQSSATDLVNNFRRKLQTRETSWKSVFDDSGLTVFCSSNGHHDGDVIPLHGRHGVAVGTLFATNDSPTDVCATRTTKLGERRTKEIADTAGRSLIASHWGSYVLFLKRPELRCVTILRGPVSPLPCFWVLVGGVRIFFSSVDDCLDLGIAPLSINWDCVLAQAAGGDYLTHETGIKEISTVLCGEAFEFSASGSSQRLYWNPASLSPSSTAEDLIEAANLMRAQTQLCINAWASPHDTILLELSGGLDSSIVLACLRRAQTRPNVISVNFYSRGAGDERRFARSMTDPHGLELIEMESDAALDFRTFLNCALTANPVLNFSAYDAEPKLIRIAGERKATAIFTGEIGDDIFGHSPSPEVLTECLATYGFSLRTLLAAIDYAELTRVSLWRALNQAIQYRRWQKRTSYWSFYRYRHWLRYSNERYLISKDAVNNYERSLSRWIHPWFQNVQDMPAGRAMLIYALIMATSTWSHSPFGGSSRNLFKSPIASQPLVEAFARITSCLHFAGGENGAVAREAFRLQLSDMVLERGTGKGTPELWIRDLVESNRSFLRELLLGGILVGRNILDKKKTEEILSRDVTKTHVGVGELIRQLYIESWLRRWTGNCVSAVA